MIPLAKDTRAAIGAYADKVENRSLLFEKMVLAKSWGHPPEVKRLETGQPNVLRACTHGDEILKEVAKDHRAKNRYQAKVAGALVPVPALLNNQLLARRQVENANQLLALLEKSYEGRSHTFVADLAGRLLINMAGGVQENAGISLDRCFGLPVIPGSAVKGVTRNAALWDIRRTTDPDERKRKVRMALLAFGFIGDDLRKGRRTGDFVWAAGDNAELVREAGKPITHHDSFKGLLSFLPAYPASVPRIVAEVLTPHPRANERRDPHPIFFPAVESGSSFGFAIVAPWLPEELTPGEIAEVLAQAGSWLRRAVTVEGIGAKTGAGYGWFVIDPQAEARRREEMAEAARREEEEARKRAAEAEAEAAEKARVAAMSPEEKAAEEVRNLSPEEFAMWAKNLAEKSESEQRAFLMVLGEKDNKDTRKRWKRNKASIWNAVLEVASKLGINLE